MSAAPDGDDDSFAEKAVDAAVHALGLLGAGAALRRLFANIGPHATTDQRLALVVYSLGLIGVLTMSALYNLSPTGPWKGVLRRCDRAMIFVMIAGSYTPFAVTAFAPGTGRALCFVVWAMAALGVSLCLAWQRLSDRISIALYLGMGWLVLAILPPLVSAVSVTVLILLLAGGVVYSLGVIVHTRVRIAFHNAVWHGMVVTAAALHLTAIALVLP
jgi:hemolysin III